MTDGGVVDLGRAEAVRSAAFLARALPPELVPVFGERFIRSHILYGEFVARLVLGIGRAIGLGEALAVPGTASDIAARTAIDPSQGAIPLEWMLRFLAARGFIRRAPDAGATRYRADALPAPDPALVRAEQRAWDVSWEPAYTLAEAVAQDYPEFLRGRVAGEDVLFAPRRLRLWVDYFSNDNGLYAVNNRIGAFAAARWMPERGGVILELGGGLGSGALALLDELASTGRLAAASGYRFTELVPAFLRRGEQSVRARYADLPGLTFSALDIDRPFSEQGVEGGSVALVYAVNTLHAARDLAFTLGQIRDVLAPGGRLVIGECAPPPAPIYAEFVFNLARTFRAPLLGPHRPHGGFLAPEHWRAAFEAARLTDVRVVPDLDLVRAGVPDFGVAAIGAARAAGRGSRTLC